MTTVDARMSPAAVGDMIKSLPDRPRQHEEVEDIEEVLPDGTVHHVHKVHRHSVKVTRKSLKSESGEEQVVEEQENVPGTNHDEIVETFQEPPRLVHEEEEVVEVLPDGTRVTRKVMMNRMLSHIHKHQESFDEGTGGQKLVEDYEFDEVVPGTESAFMQGVDSSTESESEEELSEHQTTDVRETTELLDDGTLVKKALLTTETTRKVRSRSGSIDRSETSARVEEEAIIPSPRPRSPMDAVDGAPSVDPYDTTGKHAVRTDTRTSHLEETRHGGTVERTLEVVEDMLSRGALTGAVQPEALSAAEKRSSIENGGDGPAAGDDSLSQSHDGDEEVQTHRLVMKKEVHTKTMLGVDGSEQTSITEDSQVQQENEPPEELRESMQEIINQFMTSDTHPAPLPPSGGDLELNKSREEDV